MRQYFEERARPSASVLLVTASAAFETPLASGTGKPTKLKFKNAFYASCPARGCNLHVRLPACGSCSRASFARAGVRPFLPVNIYSYANSIEQLFQIAKFLQLPRFPLSRLNRFKGNMLAINIEYPFKIRTNIKHTLYSCGSISTFTYNSWGCDF